MKEILLQYMLIIFLVIGIGYLLYLLKDRGMELYEDYFGLTYAILNTLQSDERGRQNIKRILRTVGEAVRFIEIEYFNESNEKKETEAVKLVYELLQEDGFESPIDEQSIRYIIRISSAMLPCKKEIAELKQLDENNKS
ncbi:hypothetical protein [Hathewaya massiliensis]|uniref:hypothetical protein n=1 Tax=Hathewaya massiliensis TaxID=1964382 RepID=UPI00115B4493|nr:hypothetical protein [Hathewaya massiliensis]